MKALSHRVVASGLCLVLAAAGTASAELFGFETGVEGWEVYGWDPGCTNVAQSASWGYGGSAHSLRMDCVFTNTAADTKGWAGVIIPAQNLQGSQIAMRVYCPAGASGTNTQAWAWTQLRVWLKDKDYKYQESAWDAFRVTNGVSTQTLSYTVTGLAWDSSPFDSTNVIQFGIQVCFRGAYGGTYVGPYYIDAAGFGADYLSFDNLRYDFEANKEGWEPETYPGITGVTAVARSASYALHATNSLRMDLGIRCDPYTNRQQGAAKVDMRFYPPPVVRAPFDLSNRIVQAFIYCPAGAQSTNPSTPNQVRVYVKDTNWASQYGSYATMKDGEWVRASLTVTTNGGLLPSKIIEVGVDLSMVGTYTNALYLDALSFPASPSAALTNSQHAYDFETAGQAEWWRWDTNPQGWNALAWTNTYYATNHGSGGSVALAADGTFQIGVDQVVTNGGVVTTNVDVMRKAVFEIGYQPALNLSTKDHRKIQAKLEFVPPIEGLLGFDASINVYDKVSDQWYFKDFKIGGSSWNILDFDLDNAADYATNSPAGPMNASAIGFVNIQLYANAGWTGTVYLEDVVVGGRETGTNYNKLASAFVRADGPKFVIGGTNFYFCGANIEYLQTESDAIVTQCFAWAQSNHLQMIRTWAMQEGKPYSYQPQRGVWNELMFEHLDRIVAEAGHRGIRLMLGLVDNWAHNGGIFQYVHWAKKEHPETVNTNLDPEGVEYHDQFWTNTYCRQWYRDYVGRLLNRTNTITGVQYKNDPTVMGWEIVNEPRCESDFSGRTIHDWLHDMSDWVRTIDTNHLLGPGEEGGYVNTYDFADTIPWEVYPDNYYHYGTYAVGSPTCDLYGCGRGHGVDFISDMKSSATWVQWQDGFYTNKGPTNAEWRSGNSNINFCTARIYVDQKEYNVWRTNLNSADQRIEWINDHWYDAHRTIGKPMILEEFGIHAIGWIFNGSYGQVQLVRTPSYTQTDRVNIYDMYYKHIERSGIPGSCFWNFGFDGMWEDPFSLCEQVGPWSPNLTNGSATAIAVSTNYVLQGTNSLQLSWNVTESTNNKAIFVCSTGETWVLRVDNTSTAEPPTRGVNRVKFFWNIYNPSTTNIEASLALRGAHITNIWAESLTQTVTSGWNRLMFDLSAGTWAWWGSSWAHDSYLIQITNAAGSNVLEDVTEVNLCLYYLTNGTGAVYIDDIQIKRDDGFVIYADDPVNPVIKAHADRMAARNVATNSPNNVPTASSLVVTAAAFRATNVLLQASDLDGDVLSYRIIQRPTNGWVFGSPPSNIVYKSKPGTEGGDTFTFTAHDGKADSAEATITIVMGSTDTDSDSLPDSWEFTYFPKHVQYWPYDADSLTNLFTTWDWDGDDFSDYCEYRAGTDPTSDVSYLYVSAVVTSYAGQFYVRWPSVAGRSYEMQRSTNLVSAVFTNLLGGIAAAPPMNTYTDVTAGGQGPFLYRVRVE